MGWSEEWKGPSTQGYDWEGHKLEENPILPTDNSSNSAVIVNKKEPDEYSYTFEGEGDGMPNIRCEKTSGGGPGTGTKKPTKPDSKSGKTLGQVYDENIGKYFQDGNGDIANTGIMTKEGWDNALPILGLIGSSGTLLGATSVFEIGLATLSTGDHINKIRKNALSESNKETVGKVSKTISASNAVNGIINIQLSNLFRQRAET